MIDETKLAEFVRSLPEDIKNDRSIHLFEDTWRDILGTLDTLLKENANLKNGERAADAHIEKLEAVARAADKMIYAPRSEYAPGSKKANLKAALDALVELTPTEVVLTEPDQIMEPFIPHKPPALLEPVPPAQAPMLLCMACRAVMSLGSKVCLFCHASLVDAPTATPQEIEAAMIPKAPEEPAP